MQLPAALVVTCSLSFLQPHPNSTSFQWFIHFHSPFVCSRSSSPPTGLSTSSFIKELARTAPTSNLRTVNYYQTQTLPPPWFAATSLRRRRGKPYCTSPIVRAALASLSATAASSIESQLGGWLAGSIILRNCIITYWFPSTSCFITCQSKRNIDRGEETTLL